MISWPVTMTSSMTSWLVSSTGATLQMGNLQVLPGPTKTLQQGLEGAIHTPPPPPLPPQYGMTCLRGIFVSGMCQPLRDILGPCRVSGDLKRTNKDLPGSAWDLHAAPELPCGSLGIWWGFPSPLRGRWSHRCLAESAPWDPPGGGSCPQRRHPRDRQAHVQGDKQVPRRGSGE